MTIEQTKVILSTLNRAFPVIKTDLENCTLWWTLFAQNERYEDCKKAAIAMINRVDKLGGAENNIKTFRDFLAEEKRKARLYENVNKITISQSEPLSREEIFRMYVGQAQNGSEFARDALFKRFTDLLDEAGLSEKDFSKSGK